MAGTHRFAALAAAVVFILTGCRGYPPVPSPGPTASGQPPATTAPAPSPSPGAADGHEPSPPTHPATVSGPSPFSTCTDGRFGAGSRVYPNAEVEPSIGVDPADPSVVVAAFQQDRWSDGGARGIVAAASEDGGRTWDEAALPFTSCATPGSGPARASDPWISIGPDGIVYLAAIAVGDGVRIATSTDGGRTWPTIVRIPVGSGRTFADKPAITAHPGRPGVAYAVWNEDVRAEARPRDTVLSVTTDGGTTWSTPRVILEGDPDGGGAVGDQILVAPAPGTTLYHVYNWQPFRDGKAGPAHVGLQVSTDAGATWSESRLIQDIRMVQGGTKTPNGERIRSGAGVIDGAVDPTTGSVLLVWEDARFSGGRTGEIALSRSEDGGERWSTPRRISPPGVAAAFTPAADVGPDGRLGVSFYAIRAGDAEARTDLWVLRSSDSGETFQMQTVDAPFDIANAPHADGLFLGDYMGLAAGPGGFFALYAITTAVPGETDVRAAFVP